MQIKKEDFEALNKKVHDLQKELGKEHIRGNDLEKRVIACDRILEKIVRAAEGRPLHDNPNSYGMTPGYSDQSYDNHNPCVPLTNEEILRNQTIILQDTIIQLESKLAAVKAIATFAQEHKL